MEGFWKKIKDKKPHTYKTGYGGGKMSDELFVVDSLGFCYVASCFQGGIDGGEFCSFYDNNDNEIENVTHWAEIPTIHEEYGN